MQQGRLDALSLLSIEADVLRKINPEDLFKDFAIKKIGENLSNTNKVEVTKINIIFHRTVSFVSFLNFYFI